MLGKKTSNRGRNPLVWLAPYNIYVSSAIRRCFLASLRLRRRKRARIMVTSVRRPRLVSLRLSVSLVSVPRTRNECCNQTENEEGRNGGREGGGFGAYSMTLLAAGRKDGGQTDGRTTRRFLAPFIARRRRLDSGEGGRNCARLRIHIALRAEETSRRAEGHRSPSDFCIRGAEDTFPGQRKARQKRVAIKTRVPGRSPIWVRICWCILSPIPHSSPDGESRETSQNSA